MRIKRRPHLLGSVRGVDKGGEFRHAQARGGDAPPVPAPPPQSHLGGAKGRAYERLHAGDENNVFSLE